MFILVATLNGAWMDDAETGTCEQRRFFLTRCSGVPNVTSHIVATAGSPFMAGSFAIGSARTILGHRKRSPHRGGARHDRTA